MVRELVYAYYYRDVCTPRRFAILQLNKTGSVFYFSAKLIKPSHRPLVIRLSPIISLPAIKYECWKATRPPTDSIRWAFIGWYNYAFVYITLHIFNSETITNFIHIASAGMQVMHFWGIAILSTQHSQTLSDILVHHAHRYVFRKIINSWYFKHLFISVLSRYCFRNGSCNLMIYPIILNGSLSAARKKWSQVDGWHRTIVIINIGSIG